MTSFRPYAIILNQQNYSLNTNTQQRRRNCIETPRTYNQDPRRIGTLQNAAGQAISTTHTFISSYNPDHSQSEEQKKARSIYVSSGSPLELSGGCPHVRVLTTLSQAWRHMDIVLRVDRRTACTRCMHADRDMYTGHRNWENTINSTHQH